MFSRRLLSSRVKEHLSVVTKISLSTSRVLLSKVVSIELDRLP